MSLLAYNLFLHAIAAPVLAAYYLPQILFKGKYHKSLLGKLGKLPSDFIPEIFARPRLWFHAVSVGEVVALGPLVKAIRERVPDAAVIISTGTETGQQKARELIEEADGLLYLPLDFPEFVKPVVERIQPDLFVLMETELWPNLIVILKTHGARIALANGRISDRSFPRYKRLRSFFSSTLERIDLFLMSSEIDGQRITEMGAAPDAVRITGNTKFDAALAKLPEDEEIVGETFLCKKVSPTLPSKDSISCRQLGFPNGEAQLPDEHKVLGEDCGEDLFTKRSSPRSSLSPVLGLSGSEMVLVAGSVHPGEYEIVLDAYKDLTERFPDLILILVPRHIERTPQILSAMKDRGMEPPFLRSTADAEETRNDRQVIVVDRIGELFEIFSLASVVFVGGSLVPRGGQNILEPAAWGKVVLFGPSMEDFREARDVLVSAGAGIPIRGAEDIVRWCSEMLSNPEEAQARGKRGRDEILKNVGSAKKNAELLVELLK
jgi:3-deoxy-D-manno-octulosonic-acid transferase